MITSLPGPVVLSVNKIRYSVRRPLRQGGVQQRQAKGLGSSLVGVVFLLEQAVFVWLRIQRRHLGDGQGINIRQGFPVDLEMAVHEVHGGSRHPAESQERQEKGGGPPGGRRPAAPVVPCGLEGAAPCSLG